MARWAVLGHRPADAAGAAGRRCAEARSKIPWEAEPSSVPDRTLAHHSTRKMPGRFAEPGACERLHARLGSNLLGQVPFFLLLLADIFVQRLPQRCKWPNARPPRRIAPWSRSPRRCATACCWRSWRQPSPLLPKPGSGHWEGARERTAGGRQQQTRGGRTNAGRQKKAGAGEIIVVAWGLRRLCSFPLGRWFCRYTARPAWASRTPTCCSLRRAFCRGGAG